MAAKSSRPRLAVGLMSGTSMDGVDAALVEISGPPEKPRVRLRAFASVPYPSALRRKLLSVAGGQPIRSGELSQLNFLLGQLFADAALVACRCGETSPARLAFIGSHGQTLYHQPLPSREAGRNVASTLQIAEPAILAQMTGVPVVADFRPTDMAAGGQGAPLVPMVDYLLLRSEREGVVALNIGGIANVTVIPVRANPEKVFGFDTGPGNMVIDTLVRYFTGGKKSCDVGGRLARRGKVIEPLIAEALLHPFLKLEPPKSTGREYFGDRFVKACFLRRKRARFEDLVRTATELTAHTIADALRRFVFPKVEIQRLVVSGGGAHNQFLMSRIAALLPELRVELSDKYGLPVDAKEAVVFAVLADRTMHGLPGNLPSVTGARRAVVLGKIVRP